MIKKESKASAKKSSPAPRKAAKLSKALVAAAAEGNEALVIELLALGADATAQHKMNDVDGDAMMATPLMAAAYGAHAGCFFRLLPVSDATALSAGTKNCCRGRDALARALHGGSREIIEALIPLADPASLADDGRSALCIAAAFGRASAVKSMLARGWSAMTQSRDGATPLIHATECRASSNSASEMDFVETARLLLNAMDPAAIAAKNEIGYTAFHLALMRSPDSLAELLWSEAAQAILTPNERCGAMLATEFDRGPLLQKMLPFVDLEKVDAVEWSLLEIAAHFSSVKCLSVLLEAGVDFSRRFKDGHNVLTRVVFSGMSRDDADQIARQERRSLLAAHLLAPLGTLAQDANADGLTALMLATVRTSNTTRGSHGLRMAQILLPWSDPTALDSNGKPALLWAIERAAKHWSKLCKENCASSISGEPCKNDAELAQESDFCEFLAVVERLCPSSAAMPRLPNGDTVLMRAVNDNAPSAVIEILLRHFDPKAWRVEPDGKRARAAEIAVMRGNVKNVIAIASAQCPFESEPANHGFQPMPSIVEFAMQRALASFGKSFFGKSALLDNAILDALFELPCANFQPTAEFVLLALSSGHEKWALRAMGMIDIASLSATPALSLAARMGSASCVHLLSSQSSTDVWLDGLSPLGWAARACSPECLLLLLPGRNAREATWSGASALESLFDSSALDCSNAPDLLDRQTRCADILLASDCGGEVAAFYGALRVNNLSAAGILAPKAFSVQGLPALLALIRGGGACFVKPLADSGAKNGLDLRGQDIFDAAVWRYNKSPDSCDDLKKHILALIDAFGINSSTGNRSLAQRFASMFRSDPDFIGQLEAMKDAEDIRLSCSNAFEPESPSRALRL